MIIHPIKHPFGHIIIENTFNDGAYELVWEELMFLEKRMKQGYDTGASSNRFGSTKKNGNGIFLDQIFVNPRYSDIYIFTRELVGNSIANAASQLDPYFGLFYRIILDTIIVQCYKNGDYYLPHKDDSIFTIVTLMHNTPKKYSGGELYFPEYNYQVSIENNQSIIFPSRVLHEVKEVVMDSKDPKDCRYTISMFLEDRNTQSQG